MSLKFTSTLFSFRSVFTYHKITELVRLEGTTEAQLVQPPMSRVTLEHILGNNPQRTLLITTVLANGLHSLKTRGFCGVTSVPVSRHHPHSTVWSSDGTGTENRHSTRGGASAIPSAPLLHRLCKLRQKHPTVHTQSWASVQQNTSAHPPGKHYFAFAFWATPWSQHQSHSPHPTNTPNKQNHTKKTH